MPSGLDESITSLQNPKIKELIKLRQKRRRDQTQQYFIEGYREILRAFESKTLIKQLYFCESLFLGENEHKLMQELSSEHVELILCSEKVFRHISYRDRPDGLLALAPIRALRLEELKIQKPNPLYILAVGIEKPGNLGTILRSADAVGADGVFIVDQVTDQYNPNVVRASVGTLFTQPVIDVSTEEIFNWLKLREIQIIASSPDAKVNYTTVDYKKPTAFLVGCEQYGLNRFWLENANVQVSLPMLGKADSLNAATSTTVLLYEALRQRQAS